MCPPGVDQTCRTRQRWHVLAPALHENHDLTDFPVVDKQSYNPKIQHFLASDKTWNAFEKFAIHPRSSVNVEPPLTGLPRRQDNAALSPLEVLPLELFDMIASEPCLDANDIIAMGLCSQILWGRILHQIQQRIRRGLWVSTPVALTGTWLTDLPPAIHDLHPDIQVAEKAFFKDNIRGRGMAPRLGMCPARRWNWNAISHFRDVAAVDPNNVWHTAIDDFNSKGLIPPELLEVLLKSMEAVFNGVQESSQKETEWVLRNLTLKEYVVLKRSATNGEELHVKGMSSLSVDKALISRICWSVRSVNTSPESQRLNELRRGPWAGHCFDIIPSKPLSLGNTWKDVTMEIMNLCLEYQGPSSSY